MSRRRGRPPGPDVTVSYAAAEWLLDTACGLITSVDGGWESQTPEWQDAARRWRDAYVTHVEARDGAPRSVNPSDPAA